MHRFTLAVFLCAALFYTNGKPMLEVLPHSRDYYAGYIKAITDNFDQLFSNERQTRSTGEDDEIPSATITKQNLGEERNEQLVKRDITEDVEVRKKESNTTQKKDKVGQEKVKAEQTAETTPKDKSADKKSETIDDEDEEDEKETDVQRNVVNNIPQSETKDERTSTAVKLDALENEPFHDQHETKIIDKEVEKSDDTEADEIENDNESSEIQSGGVEAEMRRHFILEHANMGPHSPLFPHILSGYQEEPAPQYPGEVGSSNENLNPPPLAFVGSPLPPYGFAYGQPMISNSPQETDGPPLTGEARSSIKSKSGKRTECTSADPHHLHRILLLPQCCNHQCCHHHDDHHCSCCDQCGHHGGHHGLVHDVHHWPVGCPEHYSHESPCLTYPHVNHVGYGYPQGGNDCCCNGAYHSHHPVILHPTYQECHHHNIHTIGADCHDNCHHDCHHDCCCQNHCGHDCGHHVVCEHHPVDIHHHVNHIQHVCDNCHQDCHPCHQDCHHNYHHGQDHEINILPHYGHTAAGHHGWNPYWGH